MIAFDSVRLSGLTDIELPIFGIKPTDPFQVTNIDGLGPPELEVQLAETHSPGGVFVSRRAPGRQIVIRAGLNPDYKFGQTVADLRHLLYGLLSPRTNPKNQSIDIYLLSNNVPTAQTSGYVKRIEIVPFSQTPEVQVTIDCLGPYLDAPDVVSFDVPAGFSWYLDYEGSAPTGLSLEFEFLLNTPDYWIGIVDDPVLFTPSSQMIFQYPPGFLENDRIVVDTNEATRFVGLMRGGEYIAYSEILSGDSEWLFLYGGQHEFYFSNWGIINWLKFDYRPRYWGI